MREGLKTVGRGVRKKDAMQLLLGKPAYVDDVTPSDCLVVKVLRRRIYFFMRSMFNKKP